ncbi:hypothetical protein CMO96_03715 [Candidatus Woesebacteria bacterium]|nr:hypothetical protein [Candidatus Woesebacteria bacterium]
MLLAAFLIYTLLPHERNNHRAKLLNPIVIGLSILMFLVTQVLVSSLPRFTPVVLGYASNINSEEIVQLTNEEREQAGVPEVQVDPILTQAALKKGGDMFAKDYWAHTAPDGTEPWVFFADQGYKYRFAGENLARDFANSETTVAAWMNSRSHRDNLLSSRYQDIGVAVIQGDLDGVETTLVIQFFGTRMDQSPLVETNIGAQPAASLDFSPEATVVGSSTVIGASKEKGNILLSPFSTTRNLAIFLVSLFFLVITLDMIIIRHRNVARVSSKSFAHFIFFGAILAVLYFSREGLIL